MWYRDRNSTDYIDSNDNYTIALNHYFDYGSFAQENADAAWFAELDKRMANGIKQAKKRHERPLKQYNAMKIRPQFYKREPRLSANWLRKQEKC